MNHRTRHHIIAFAAVVGIAVRVVIAMGASPNADTINFQRSAEIFAHGSNIYVEQFYYNYSPAIGLLLGILHHFPFVIAFRFTMIGASLAVALLLYRITDNPLVFLAYWLNPASVLFDAHGDQFDVLAVLPLLIAVAYKLKGTRLFLLCALAVVVKHNTIFLVWALLVHEIGMKRAALWMVGIVALFAASFIPYLPAGAPHIVERVLMYQSWGNYGFSLFLSPIVSRVLFFGVMLTLPLVLRKMPLVDALQMLMLAQVAFIYGSSFNVPALLALMSLTSNVPYIAASVVLMLLYNDFRLMVAEPINTFSGVWLVATVTLLYRTAGSNQIRAALGNSQAMLVRLIVLRYKLSVYQVPQQRPRAE